MYKYNDLPIMGTHMNNLVQNIWLFFIEVIRGIRQESPCTDVDFEDPGHYIIDTKLYSVVFRL